MNRVVLSFLVFISTLALQAQVNLDSLYRVWEDPSQSDSVRVAAYKAFIWEGYLFSDPDSAAALTRAMHEYAETYNYPKARNQANTLDAIVYEMKGDYSSAIDCIQKSLEGSREIDDKWGISENQIVMGVMYDEQGDYPRALEHYNLALSIDEEIGNKEGIAMGLNNIGNIYSFQENDSTALEYYLRALAIDEELGVAQGVATELINIGAIYKSQGKMDQALEFFERALEINTEIGDNDGIAGALKQLGSFYITHDSTLRALHYYERALEVYQQLGSKRGEAAMKKSIGQVYLVQGKVQLALDLCHESLVGAEEIGALTEQSEACKCLYMAYKSIENNSKALEYHEKWIDVKNSIYNEENTKKLTRLHMQYEFDKKEAATKAEQEKKDAIAVQELRRQKLVRNGFMGGFAVVLLFAGVFLVQRNRIGKEKERSEELLLNILPEETAKELKEKGRSDAQLIEKVTVLFTDFKGFTALSEKLSPEALVKDLHECFSAFDRICEKYGIEKIKTIGDAYMAAGGLPTPNSTHAQDVVKAALEMSEFVEKGKRQKIESGEPFFEIRIGVHTGPVVAGIVGIKKFQYDIWGDTVNTASRMESSGEVGKVNVSQTTYEQLKEHSEFAFTFRGEVQAKGKGMLAMYFVEGGKS